MHIGGIRIADEESHSVGVVVAAVPVMLALLLSLLGHNPAWGALAKVNIGYRNLPLKAFGNSTAALKATRYPVGLAQDSVLETQVRNRIAKIDQAFRNLFPELMRNKDFPDFVVTNDDDPFSVGTVNGLSEQKFSFNRGVLTISRGFLKNPDLSEPFIMGVLAHEIGHLFLGHVEIDTTVLSVTGNQATNLARYFEKAQTVGKRVNSELNGYPVGASLLTDAFSQLKGQIGAEDPACLQRVGGTSDAINDMLRTHFSVFDWDLEIKNDPEFTRLMKLYQQQLVECTAKGTYVRVLRERYFRDDGAFPVLPETFISNHGGSFVSWGSVNEMRVIFDVGATLQREMRDLIAAMGQVEWRSFEDEADEAAIAVLRFLQLDSLEFGRSTLALFESREKGFTQRCLQAVATGKSVPFGYLADPHHSPCFRYQRIFKLSRNPNFAPEF